MKKIRTGIIALMLCMLSAFTAFAAQGTISFSDPQVTAGDEVNVSMKITADEGTALSSANVVLTYPTDSLEFVSGTDADGGAGAVRVHGTTNGGGTAELNYNLKFKTSAAGSFAIAVDSYEVYDGDDQPVEFTHVGNSSVTVNGVQGVSTDTSLSQLDVYPGTLDPAFSADITIYNVTVGLGVGSLNINAIAADSSSVVKISGNENLPEGDSAVTVTVDAADGTSSQNYIINVSKVEGGPESTESEIAATEGVQLSSKGKTITIMNPTEDVQIPEGFKQGTISIDDQKVQGWVWGASEEPEYCVVYGMNDKGEINFYRYDMKEKTIQRYFEDPLAADSVSNAEYSELETQLATAQRSAETRLIIMVALAVIAFAAVMVSVYMSVKFRTAEKLQKANRRKNVGRYRGTEDSTSDSSMNIPDKAGAAADESDAAEHAGRTVQGIDRQLNEAASGSEGLLKHDFSADAGDADINNMSAADETQVIRRPERRRRPKRYRTAEPLENMNEQENLQSDMVSDNMTDSADNAGAFATGAAAADCGTEVLNGEAFESDTADTGVSQDMSSDVHEYIPSRLRRETGQTADDSALKAGYDHTGTADKAADAEHTAASGDAQAHTDADSTEV